MRRIAVGDIMTKNLVTVEPLESLYECTKKMVKEKVSTILVTKGKKLYGILTARDILWAITKKSVHDLRAIRCIDVAKRKIAVIKPSADLNEAIGKMREVNFRRLPVLSHGELIGVVTLRDVLAIEPLLYGEMKSLMDEIREEENKMKLAGADWPLEGLCDNCGAFSELLKIEDRVLCRDCRDEIY